MKQIAGLLISMIFIMSSCNMESSQKEINQLNLMDEQITEFLSKFYTEYIKECNAPPKEGLEGIQKIKKKFCTSKFLEKIKEEEQDYDPIINAQDCNEDWIKTLTVRRDTNNAQGNLYIVCFMDFHKKSLHCLNVCVKKENNVWKVDDVSGTN
jgi:hypothetical protein